ncbi:DUF4124 domain-containing protein [Thiolapillus brandeum]|uniref:DUF4124 domain-containing protein n=1 Tax=Thiolapillus brandeum TaxID=1076588 RepID=A0A7U6GGR8_9GAMM|nr:DUF4124 domain-containing protein [Thiolapillus brandeum]BAO43274.1 conserved hypothetical protein [Thiolapillus brandeum]
MKTISFIILALAFSLAQGEIYKWVDGEGNIHYGDQPESTKAKPMKKLPGLSTYAPPVVPERDEALDDGEEGLVPGQAPATDKAASQGYRSISIISPEDQGTVRSSPGNVSVFVALAPVLRKGDYLKVILDGTPSKEKYQSMVINLQNVNRGEHKLAVAVYNKQGMELLRSDTRTFFLHRTIAKPRRSPR